MKKKIAPTKNEKETLKTKRKLFDGRRGREERTERASLMNMAEKRPTMEGFSFDP